MAKLYNFRGPPAALGVMARRAGFDALNLANNHVGDYGRTALLDTVRHVRRAGIAAVGAGGSLASASRPRVVRRLGLRVAFVGFSDILPASFYAGPRQAGTQPASLPAIRAGVRRARRRRGRGDRHLPLGRRAGAGARTSASARSPQPPSAPARPP